MLLLPFTSSHKSKPPRRKQIYRKAKELLLRLVGRKPRS